MLRSAVAGGFCGILGAFPDLFQWLQTATLGSSLLATGFCCILGAVAWLQMPRGAVAGGFCGILGAFQELSSGSRKQR